MEEELANREVAGLQFQSTVPATLVAVVSATLKPALFAAWHGPAGHERTRAEL